MTIDRRRQRIVARPDGSLWDEAAMADYLRDMDRRAVPAPLVRLSLTDSAILALTPKGRAA